MGDWSEYLHRRHSPERLRAWALSLRHFRFCRAYGGHNNDGDQLLVSLEVAGERDVSTVLDALGVPGPGHATIAGQPVYVQTLPGRLEIGLSDPGDPYEVSATSVRSARAIEPLLDPLAPRIVDPPRDDHHCVCPKYYPDIWAGS